MKTKNPAREERLAAALRENLKRRKAHDRAVATTPKAQPETAVEPRPNRAPKSD
jgi:hypothetical protein